MAYLATGIAAVALALVHITAWRLHFLGGYPRSIWLSIGAGISVAYVFLFLLPELHEYQEILAEETSSPLDFFDFPLYLLAFLGLLTFYGLEHAARPSRTRGAQEDSPAQPRHRIFWLHTVSYSVYNGLIGYLLLFQWADASSTLVFFTIAMMLHFTVNDYALQDHHENDYTQFGRWILAAAVILGWALSVVVQLPDTTVSFVLAFVVGGLVINLLKEELPEERSSRFWAFLLGAGAYTVLLYAL